MPWYPTWNQWDMDEALKQGHALVIAAWMGDFTPAADFETAYLVHDPNVFPGSGTSFYRDGTSKGAYRRYSWWELWGTVSRYARGQALAIVPPTPLPDPNAPKRVLLENTVIYDGPGGGHEPRRGVTSEIVPPSER